jgi:hypothetical protein
MTPPGVGNVTSSITTPKIVAEVPVFGSLDLASIDLTKSPLSCPRTPLISRIRLYQVASEGNAGNRHDDQKDRRQRRNSVKGNCRASRQGFVGDEAADSRLKNIPHLRHGLAFARPASLNDGPTLRFQNEKNP